MIDLTKLHEHDKFLLAELVAMHALLLDPSRQHHELEEIAVDACNAAECLVAERNRRQSKRDGEFGS